MDILMKVLMSLTIFFGLMGILMALPTQSQRTRDVGFGLIGLGLVCFILFMSCLPWTI